MIIYNILIYLIYLILLLLEKCTLNCITIRYTNIQKYIQKQLLLPNLTANNTYSYKYLHRFPIAQPNQIKIYYISLKLQSDIQQPPLLLLQLKYKPTSILGCLHNHLNQYHLLTRKFIFTILSDYNREYIYTHKYLQSISTILNMEPESTNTLSILLDSFDIPSRVDKFTDFFTGFLLNNISIKFPTEINKINDLIKMLNTAIIDGLITNTQRRNIAEKMANKKYPNLSILESQFNILFEDSINSNLGGDKDKLEQKNTEADLSQKFIQQLLAKQEEQKKNKQKAEEQSQLLIKQLQLKEQESIKKKLLQASKIQIKMQCPICLEEIKLVDLALLSCQHAFHRYCMFKHLAQSIDERKFPMTCPGCPNECIASDVKEYLNNQYLAKYQRVSFENYVNIHHEDMSWCPTAGCQYVFCFDQEETQFNCPLCHKVYCLRCKVAYHTGMTCKEFNINRVFDKNDEKFIEFVKGAKYKQCPSCKFWVQKNQGCDHMTCRCKYQFCYVCGGKYLQCECSQNVIPRPGRAGIRPVPHRGRGGGRRGGGFFMD